MQHDPTPHADARSLRAAVLVAGIVGLALVAVMISRTSDAAFTSSTSNTGNSFTGGTVTLTDNDAEAVMFDLPAMNPGQSYTSCIDVEYSGTVTTPSAVKVYSGATPGGSTTLGDHIELTIERGTSNSVAFGSCGTSYTLEATPVSGVTLNTFTSSQTDYTTGLGTWTPTAPDTKTYRITVTLLSTVPDTEEGASVTGVNFTWEIQS